MKNYSAVLTCLLVVVALTSLAAAASSRAADDDVEVQPKQQQQSRESSRYNRATADPFETLVGRMNSVIRLHDRQGRQVGSFLFDTLQTIYNFVAELIVGMTRSYSPRLADFTRTLFNRYFGTSLAEFQ